jgi:hypothetical protein
MTDATQGMLPVGRWGNGRNHAEDAA